MYNILIYNFLISLFGFGSGTVFLSYVYNYFVNTNIISLDTYNLYVGITESLPGPTSVKILTLISYGEYGFLFTILAILVFMVPTICLIILAIFILEHKTTISFFNLLGYLFTPVLAAIIVQLVATLLIKNVNTSSKLFLVLFLTVFTYGLKKTRIKNNFLIIVINFLIITIIQTRL